MRSTRLARILEIMSIGRKSTGSPGSPGSPGFVGDTASVGETARALGRAVAGIWTHGRRLERVAYVVGAALAVSGLAHLVFLLVSGGSWEGPLSLRKPTTFGLSFGLTLATVAWASSYVRIRSGIRMLLLGVFTVVCVVETALVTMQAWRGVPSHFNFETAFDNAVSMTLAAGGGVIILTILGFTAATIVGVGEVEPSMRVALRVGLVTLVAALAFGAMMIATGVVEARGGNPQLAYDTAGALKPAHAVAMHGILVLPGLAWLMRFTGWSSSGRVRLMWLASVAYAALIAVVAVESFTGVSPLAPGMGELAVSGIAVLALAGVGVATVVRVIRDGRAAARTT